MAGGTSTVSSRPRLFATPTHERDNTEIIKIYKKLAATGLDLDTSELPRSPSTTPVSPANDVKSLIRFLYFQDRDKLLAIINGYLAWCFLNNETEVTHRLYTLREALQKAKESIRRAGPPRSLSERLAALSGNKQNEETEKSRANELAKDGVLLSGSYNDYPKPPAPHSLDTSLRDTRSCLDPSFFNDSGFGSGTSTAATSFQEQTVPSASQIVSDYGSQFGPEEEQRLLALGAAEHQENTPRSGCPPLLATTKTQNQLQNTERIEVDKIGSVLVPSAFEQGPAHYLLRNMPHERLVNIAFPTELGGLPISKKWILFQACSEDEANFTRVQALVKSGVCPDAIVEQMMSWTQRRLRKLEVNKQAQKPFCGRLLVQSNRRRRAMLQFSPLSAGNDAPSRVEKHFGANRFLSVAFTYPGSSLLKDLGPNSACDFKLALRKFLRQDQWIFGTRFKCFHVENRGRNDQRLEYGFRYFAVDGRGAEPDIDLPTLIDWAISTSSNLNAPYCKLWSRLDLSLSRTTSTITFLPQQIRLRELGSTIYGDNTPESTEFNDPNLDFSRVVSEKAVVMNDGCSLMSVAAARQICELLKFDTPWPVVFQGRINGAKGLWSIAGAYDNQSQDLWISINDSQLKIEPRSTDLVIDTCDEGRWTFEIVNHSTMPEPSYLYLDFLPILESRGVPKETIIEVVMEGLCMEFDTFFECLDSPESLRLWVTTTFAGKEARNRELHIPRVAGFPKDYFERVLLMSRSGFDIHQNKYLAKSLILSLDYWLKEMLQKLKTRSEQSVMPFGIADPFGCLTPGEISMHFSQPVSGIRAGSSQIALECEVLVARLPALRDSDVQRVRAVYKPELSHLKNVVVFPSKGSIPLASKLQGGDYDGDTFWVCWDPRLVTPFKNAPPPTMSKPPEYYGIKQDRRTVQQIFDDADHPAEGISRLMNEATNFTFQDSLLGKVTEAHKRYAYKKQSLSHPYVQELADIRDLIIDARKNGYCWNDEDYRSYMKKIGNPATLSDPAYKIALKMEDGLTKFVYDCHESGAKQHILDVLVFDHIIPQVRNFLSNVSEKLQVRRGDQQNLDDPVDNDLTDAYDRFCSHAITSPTYRNNVEHLKTSVLAVITQWSERSRFIPFWEALEDCYTRFKTIEPISADDSVAEALDTGENSISIIAEWKERIPKYDLSKWEKVRASALYAQMTGKRGLRFKLAFWLAGDVLCSLKARSQPGSVVMAEGSYNNLRERKRRKTMHKGKVMNSHMESEEDKVGSWDSE